jgi:hypothetical protein
MKYKIKELIAFLTLLTLFITYVTCRDFDPETETGIIKNHVCENKSMITGSSAGILFGTIFMKYIKKFVDRKINANKNLKKKK